MKSATVSVSTTGGISASITSEWQSENENSTSANSNINDDDEPKDSTLEAPPADAQLVTYTIAVKTSDKSGAGTDAKVFVQLLNDKVISPVIPLEQSTNHRSKFVRNQSDVFIFPNMRSIGDIQRLKIWHDNFGSQPSWHLKIVEVHDSYSNLVHSFPCDEWLSEKKEKGGQLCRILECKATRLKMPKLFHINHVHPSGGQNQCATVQQQIKPVVIPQNAPQLHTAPVDRNEINQDSFSSTDSRTSSRAQQ